MVHVAITIDTECDKDPKWRIRRPLSFRGIYDGVGERLQPLFEKHGAVPTYFLSPEVLEDVTSAELFARMGERAELGTHLHAEFVAPDPIPDASGTDRMQNSFPAEIERAKLANLTELFVATFGRRPTSFRAGRFGIGPDSLRFLQELGYLVDSSVAPLAAWNDPGGVVDFRRAGERLYYNPSEADFLAEGTMRILEIPVTIRSSFWSSVPSGIRPALMKSRLVGGVVRRLAGPSSKITWLRPWSSTLERMIELSERTIARNRHLPVVPLVMMFHNMEVIPGCSPYPQTEKDADRYLSDLEAYIAYGVKKGWRFEGITDIARRLQGGSR